MSTNAIASTLLWWWNGTPFLLLPTISSSQVHTCFLCAATLAHVSLVDKSHKAGLVWAFCFAFVKMIPVPSVLFHMVHVQISLHWKWPHHVKVILLNTLQVSAMFPHFYIHVNQVFATKPSFRMQLTFSTLLCDQSCSLQVQPH